MNRRLSKTHKASARPRGRSVEPRWLALLLLLIAVALVPWTAGLAVALPSDHVSRHWDIAWAGFDIGLATAIAATAVAVWRRSRFVPFVATVTATLLVADAWFDVVTARGGEELQWALLRAVAAEIPLAVLCVWVARRSFPKTQETLRAPASPEASGAEQHAARV